MNDEWRGTHPDIGPERIVVTADRDRPNTYVSIVQFASFEKAMTNSADPQTTEWSTRMQAFCDGPPSFRNLDVIMTEVRTDHGQRQHATA
jgi:hypothetical protein